MSARCYDSARIALHSLISQPLACISCCHRPSSRAGCPGSNLAAEGTWTDCLDWTSPGLSYSRRRRRCVADKVAQTQPEPLPRTRSSSGGGAPCKLVTAITCLAGGHGRGTGSPGSGEHGQARTFAGVAIDELCLVDSLTAVEMFNACSSFMPIRRV